MTKRPVKLLTTVAGSMQYHVVCLTHRVGPNDGSSAGVVSVELRDGAAPRRPRVRRTDVGRVEEYNLSVSDQCPTASLMPSFRPSVRRSHRLPQCIAPVCATSDSHLYNDCLTNIVNESY